MNWFHYLVFLIPALPVFLLLLLLLMERIETNLDKSRPLDFTETD